MSHQWIISMQNLETTQWQFLGYSVYCSLCTNIIVNYMENIWSGGILRWNFNLMRIDDFFLSLVKKPEYMANPQFFAKLLATYCTVIARAVLLKLERQNSTLDNAALPLCPLKLFSQKINRNHSTINYFQRSLYIVHKHLNKIMFFIFWLQNQYYYIPNDHYLLFRC